MNMKKIKMIWIAMIISIIIVGCGAAQDAPPTLDPAMVMTNAAKNQYRIITTM